MFFSMDSIFRPKTTNKQIKRTTSSLLRAHSRNSLNRLLFESEHSNGGGGDDRSISFRFAQLVVMTIRIVTPLSYIYLLYLLVYVSPKTIHNILYGDDGLPHTPASWRRMILYTSFTLWMIIEALFFPYYCYMFTKLLKINNNLSHFGSTRESRRKLVHRCFEALKIAAPSPEESHLYIRKAMEGYFLDIPVNQIYRQNFRSWVSWAYFGRDLNDLTNEEYEENEEYVNYIESMVQWRFEEGYSKDLMALRLTLDPLFATQRPFFFYAVIMSMNIFTHIVLYLYGFRHRREYETSCQLIYHRKASKKPKLLHTSQPKPLPIVFIHGIGIGFTHYLSLILLLPKEVDVYLIEWPHVAMQLRSTVPTSSQVTKAIVRVLDDDKHEHACFLAHSLGTTAVSWLVHDEEAKKKVAATVLTDPVTFLLCDPTVATSFVYKDPTTTLEFLTHFFVSRELFIANSLSRHFSWSENIMFVEDLEECSDLIDNTSKTLPSMSTLLQSYDNNEDTWKCKRHTIMISLDDPIIPVAPVVRYLNHKAGYSRSGHNGPSASKCIEILLLDHMLHGEMFLHPKHVCTIVDRVRVRCGLQPCFISSSSKQ